MTRDRYFRNFLVAIAVIVIDMVPYLWLGQHTDAAASVRLDTPLDRMIPFMPWTIIIYSWVYTQAFYPAFIIRSDDLFRRTVKAFVFIAVVDLVIYRLFPVTALGFRPEYTEIMPDSFLTWGTKLTLYMDPPYNLFPSQHLSTAILICIVAWAARPAWGKLVLPLTVAIGISVLTTKQHYIADIVGAFAVTYAAWWIFLRTYRREDEDRPASGWKGPAAYFVFHGCIYLAMWVLYLSGYAPWEG